MIRIRKLTPAAQYFGLKSRYPEGNGELLDHGRRLKWIQVIQPHSLCSRYTVEVRFEQDRSPIVLVLSPDIQLLAGDRDLPHTYKPVEGKPSLCLWWQRDWNLGMAISDTFLPWAAEWFWFFEHWLVTGEWLGGGSHPIPIAAPLSPTGSIQLSA